MPKIVKHTTATYKTKTGLKCDLVKLAKIYSRVGNIPERLNFDRASEIKLLADSFLILWKEHSAKNRRKKAG